MKRYIIYHLSMGILGLEIIVMVLEDVAPVGYSIGLLLSVLGGLGLVTASGYNIIQRNDTKPAAELWWLTASGALLAFLGTILTTID